MSLEGFLRPRSVAIVGATDREGSFGMHAARNALKGNTVEEIFFVNPKRKELFGKQCYPTLSGIPGSADCAVLCTPGESINGLLREAGESGIKSAMVFASGFSESSGADESQREREMTAIAQKYSMNIIGPNCLGVSNNVDGIHLWGLGLPEGIPGGTHGVGVVSQSGFVAANMLHTEYVKTSYVISTGNGNVTTLEEFAEFLVDDDRVTVVSLYIEGIKKAPVFIRALQKAAEKRKPVVVLKGGISPQGAASAVSHTGNLAGPGKEFISLLKRYGAIAVDDLEQLLCMSHMLHVLNGNYPTPPAFAAINLSGGENVLCADLADKHGIHLPDLSSETKDAVTRYLPPFATPKNPLDATTALFNDHDNVVGLLKTLEDESAVGGIIIGVNIGLKHDAVWKIFCESVVAAKELGCTKPVFALPPQEGTRNEAIRAVLENAGHPFLSAMSTGMQCLNKLIRFTDFHADESELIVALPEHGSAARPSYALSGFKSSLEMKRRGIPFPAEKNVFTVEELNDAAADMHFPLALKINSPDILHKSDDGGIRLDIQDRKEMVAAYRALTANVRKNRPDAAMEGVVVQEMAPRGLEMIVGITNNSSFGPMLLVGLGGIFVEIFHDMALCPVPCNKKQAFALLNQLRGYTLLRGFRGNAPCDIDALVDVMVTVSDYACEQRNEIKELDLNPVFVYPEKMGVCVVDASVIKYKV